jgi:hypothetical protein
MPLIDEDVSNGLKFCVMLVSGEDSITSSELLLLAGALELVAVLGEDAPVLAGAVVVVVELLDEQAARPVARRPAAATASALLLEIPLTVNFDPSSRVMRFREGLFSLGGLARAIRIKRGGRV